MWWRYLRPLGCVRCDATWCFWRSSGDDVGHGPATMADVSTASSPPCGRAPGAGSALGDGTAVAGGDGARCWPGRDRAPAPVRDDRAGPDPAALRWGAPIRGPAPFRGV